MKHEFVLEKRMKLFRWITPNLFGIFIFSSLLFCFALLMPTINPPKEASKTAQSMNRLKNIGYAIYYFSDQNSGKLPAGGDEHSWMTKVLPMLDCLDVQQMINHDLPWNDHANKKAFQTKLVFFLNPGINQTVTSDGYAAAHYSVNQNLFPCNNSISIEFIEQHDGQSNTILSGEIKENFPAWGDPANLRDLTLGLNKHPNGFGGLSKKGTAMLFVDGRVKTLSNNIDPEILRALSTPAGGEVIPDFE